MRIAIEYDGVWHFKDIKNQLDKKKEKDYIVECWCKDNKWRLIRIDEDEKLSLESIEKLVYGQTDSLIKIGKRYES